MHSVHIILLEKKNMIGMHFDPLKNVNIYIYRWLNKKSGDNI